MVQKLHIDIETYSSIELKKAGMYRYMESIDFEILLIAYAFDDNPVRIVDIAQGDGIPSEFIKALRDPQIEKHAHNAAFERNAFRTIGFDIPISEWRCSAIKAAYCGLPLHLGDLSEALKLGEKGKKATGTALIRFFSVPCKPTKKNEGRTRNMPWHDPDKWEDYKTYCMWDVEAEREVDNRLLRYSLPPMEWFFYEVDQKINDRGVMVDVELAQKAVNLDAENSEILSNRIKILTGVENPNSPAQLKSWLSDAMGEEITSLAKGEMPALLEAAKGTIAEEVLLLRSKISKASIKKYSAILNYVCEDQRAHGLFQFYGANRTGRFAGRGIQLQNLKRNYLSDLEGSRNHIKYGDYELNSILYEDISDVMSQLIRTAFIAPEGQTFVVADYSAIEARVIAWLADEQWRLEVFKTHGKIYEASAAMMFGIPIEQVTKGSSYRDKGKVAELALGYQGSVGAMKQMGGEDMGLSEAEMKNIVKVWRKTSPNIAKMWGDVENAALLALKRKRRVTTPYKGVAFEYNGEFLTMQLPSERKLFYYKPRITTNRFDREAIKFQGVDQETKKWGYIDTYGGKLVENCVQAVARDLLTMALFRLDRKCFITAMHVHDEAVAETPIDMAEQKLNEMCEIMAEPVSWAEGLPLTADGYITPFYKKD